MKRILYVLVTLFAFAGYQANAQINVDIPSAYGDIGDVVFVPVSVQFPTGSQVVEAIDGSLELTDPSVAQIIGVTANQFIQIGVSSNSKVNFGTANSYSVSDIEGVIVTLVVKLYDDGCSDVILTDISSQVNLEFIVDGVVYDDPGNDIIITGGQVCAPFGPDCALIAPPANASCALIQGKFSDYQSFSWDPIPNAVSYEIEIGMNDPDCCAGVLGMWRRIEISTTATSINRPADGTCFSFRVRAVCPNGTKSPWSSKVCSCGPIGMGGPGPQLSDTQNFNRKESGQFQLVSVPNPATNHVDITLSSWLIDMNTSETKMVIYDMSGKVVYTSEIALEETKRVDLSSFDAGVYIINVVDNGLLLSTERLIVE